MIALRTPGVLDALAAAALFGVATPAAKVLLGEASPWLLAGLLYLGSGIGLFIWRRVRREPARNISRGEWAWLGGAVLCGGVAGPGLVPYWMDLVPASGAALVLQ